MSLLDFFHGVQTVTVPSTIAPVTAARLSVIFLPYIAPTADDTLFPYDTPMLFNSRSNYAGMGSGGTGQRSLDGIFDQCGALVVGVRCKEGTSDADQFSKLIGGTDPVTGNYTGIQAIRGAESMCGVTPKLLIAPGFSHQRPVGVNAVTMTEQGQGYTTATVTFSGGGATVQATGTATIVGGAVTGIQIGLTGIGYTSAPTVTITGDGQGATATAVVGASANPVAQALLSQANSLRAHCVIDGPSTNDADALAARGDFSSRRVFFVDPWVSGFSTAANSYAVEPSSARVAGLIALTDNNIGPWASPSNNALVGVGGLGRPIDYSFGATDSRANVLNSNQIATIIRDNSFLLWGNRTCSSDPAYAFLSISRTCDLVDISIAMSSKNFVDKGLTKNYFDTVSSNVNAFMRNLKTQGAIIDGACWYTSDDNPTSNLTQGIATFEYNFSGIYPAEDVIFKSQLTDQYLSEIFASS